MGTAKVALGRALFLDPRMSADGSRSCASCHVDERGGADGRRTALGAGDQPLARNTPTIWNVAYHRTWSWDGRAGSLEEQVLDMWQGPAMGVGDGLAAKAAEIGVLPEYGPQLGAAFGLTAGDPVTPHHVAKAIAAFERTLLCGDPSAPQSEAAARGQALFGGKGRCVACHAPPTYTDSRYHNLGLNHDAEGKLIEGADLGRGAITGHEEDNHAFRTPALRDVARTAPYFHDGREPSLRAAVRYMAGGGNAQAPGRDPLLQAPTSLTEAEIDDLVAFLEWLVCDEQIEGSDDVKPVPIEAGAR